MSWTGTEPLGYIPVLHHHVEELSPAVALALGSVTPPLLPLGKCPLGSVLQVIA